LFGGRTKIGQQHLLTTGTPLASRSPHYQRRTRQRIIDVVEDIADFITDENNSLATGTRKVNQYAITLAIAGTSAAADNECTSRIHWLIADDQIGTRRLAPTLP
jgi:hypothetical protein